MSGLVFIIKRDVEKDETRDHFRDPSWFLYLSEEIILLFLSMFQKYLKKIFQGSSLKKLRYFRYQLY